nr:immunoglobulin heavy chain junction region [Macaca mulatta]MOY24016.1 immunoglobulin heavy chain junction region [Macaca mulatta]MOY24914.1 immunoglobulin heavy chain junction region [Macaca mulatta]MOY25132.1 immunoglobulin heavy chain junction region [Macaca mulatta]MOY27328.1 immunoglobulin heavy chain junction region [Macaca mulatta]
CARGPYLFPDPAAAGRHFDHW